jgi:molecular chaperone GrpE
MAHNEEHAEDRDDENVANSRDKVDKEKQEISSESGSDGNNTLRNCEEKIKDMEERLKEKESEAFDLKMENIKLKEKLRQEREIYERETKRRILKEKIDIFKEFLEVLDNIERALLSIENDNTEQTKGIRLIHDQLMKFLSSYGIKEIDVLNKPYDPNIAEIGEAVQTNDVPPNTVVKVLRSGYLIGDDVLRTAIVSVAVPLQEKKEESN